MVSTNIRQAYSEIDTFLDLIDEESRNKIPTKLREFFKKEKDNNYSKEIKPNIPVKNQNLKKETLSIIAFLNLQYWCNDDAERQRLMNVYKENEVKYKDKIDQKLGFNKEIKSEIKEQIKDITIYEKDSKFKKILNKILNILHLRK